MKWMRLYVRNETIANKSEDEGKELKTKNKAKCPSAQVPKWKSTVIVPATTEESASWERNVTCLYTPPINPGVINNVIMITLPK